MEVDNSGSTLVSTMGDLTYPLVNGYRLGEEIGGGGFSKVFRAINDQTSQIAACKVINLYISPTLGYGTPNIKELQKEVQVHKAMKHDFILEFLYSEIVGEGQEAEEKGWVKGLYMLLELAVGGDLFDKIAPDVGVPEDLAKFYFAQLVQGIDHIHQKGIAHRDLKPENLLLAANGNLKISDFGLCAVFRHKGKTRLLSGRCGSLPYVAPELGGQTGYAAEPVDIWGMGVVLYTMLAGNTPWDEPSEKSPEYMAYLSGELFAYDPWTRIGGQTRAILLGMLHPDANKRFTIQDIKSHKWSMTLSQLSREQLPDALTQGLKTNGMWAVADPVFSSQASQAYATERSQRVLGGSQWASQLNQQESQFLRGTGNITQAGEYNNTTTRFWLSLLPADALSLLGQYLVPELGAANVQTEPDRGMIRVRKQADLNKRGETQSVEGVFVVRGNDSLGSQEHSLVVMRRAKGSILRWRAFWWSVVRHPSIEPYVIRGDT